MGGRKVRRGRESFGNGMGEGGKGLLRSGVEYCGICLNGVREVLGGTRGYYGTCKRGNGRGVLLYLSKGG